MCAQPYPERTSIAVASVTTINHGHELTAMCSVRGVCNIQTNYNARPWSTIINSSVFQQGKVRRPLHVGVQRYISRRT